MRTPSLFIILVSCFCLSSFAEDIALEHVLEEFRRISTVDRRSGHEGNLRELLVRRVEELQVKWGGRLKVHVDAAGNLLITIPATGRFVNSSAVVGLQFHMDLVPAVKGAALDADLSSYYRNGVELEIEGEWLQSKDRMTSIGADNGAGMAMGMRYLSHPELEHPELELVFTVEEETTFKGALQIDLPLRSTILFNLDTEEDRVLYSGCMGMASDNVQLSLPTKISQSKSMVEVVLSGLVGGHSGIRAHTKQADAVEYALFVISRVFQQFDGAQLASLQVGRLGGGGSIANSMNLQFAMPNKNDARRLADFIRRDFSQYARKVDKKDEPRFAEKLSVAVGSRVPGPVMEKAKLNKLVSFLLAQESRIVEKDSAFSNSVKTSYRMPYLWLEPNLKLGVESANSKLVFLAALT